MNRMSSVLCKSIALIAFAGVVPVASHAAPLGSFLHLHPHATADDRVSFTVYNKAMGFRDVIVDGKTYTLQSKHNLQIKAPAGTNIYAASTMYSHRRGSVLVQVTPAIQHQRVIVD